MFRDGGKATSCGTVLSKMVSPADPEEEEMAGGGVRDGGNRMSSIEANEIPTLREMTLGILGIICESFWIFGLSQHSDERI